MIEINLLPSAGKKKSTRRTSVDLGASLRGLTGRAPDKLAVGTFAACVISLAGAGWLYTTQASREADLTGRLDTSVQDSTRLARVLAERTAALAKRDSVVREVNLINAIDEDRFIWPHVLDEVNRALPAYTWITTLAYTGTPQGTTNVVAAPVAPVDTTKPAPRLETEIPKDKIEIRLLGRTADIQALTRYMRDLESSPFLSDVQLDRSELAQEQGKDITQFQLTLVYSRPDTTMIRRAPLVVTVR